MARLWDENRRPSTIFRDNMVHDAYENVMKELGDVGVYVARGEIYRRVARKVYLSPRTVERILNHVIF